MTGIRFTRDIVRRFSNVTSEELYSKVRLILEDASLVPLRENYLTQLFRICRRECGVDHDWLRVDDSGYYFVTQAGNKLLVVVIGEVPDETTQASVPVVRDGESHHIVLDQSGSMETVNESVFAGAREVIQELPEESVVTFTTFNHVVSPGVRMSRDETLATLTTRVTSGTTALRDAIVKAVEIEEANPYTNTTIVIVTDGLDNASRATPSEVRNAVDRCNAKGWRILFLGANQDAVTTASQYGISGGRALTFNTSRAPEAFRAVSSNNRNYRSFNTDEFSEIDRSRAV